MAKSSKSSILLAHAIVWGAAIVCSLILIYGPHGPARPPKFILVSLMPLIVIAIITLLAKQASRAVVIANAVLWIAAMASSFLLVNTSLGVSWHPVTTTIVIAALGVIALGILSRATFPETVADPDAEPAES